MKKVFIDENTRSEILLILNKFGISNDIVDIANKMDLDIVSLLYEKVIINGNPDNYEVVVKSLLGVYGNCLATKYFKGLGYNVLNEVPIKNKLGKTVTSADLVFYDNDGMKNICEVKTTTQIIDNIRNYVDPDSESQSCFEDKDDEILKYKCIGKKLVKQVEKLSKSGAIVKVIIFNGCYVDDVIRKKLHELGAVLVVLSPDVYVLESNIRGIVNEIVSYLKSNGELENEKIRMRF